MAACEPCGRPRGQNGKSHREGLKDFELLNSGPQKAVLRGLDVPHGGTLDECGPALGLSLHICKMGRIIPLS